MRFRLAGLLAVVILVAGGVGCSGGGAPAAATGGDTRTAALREAALAAARVWRPPSVPIATADLGSNPDVPGGFAESQALTCRFVLREAGGTTPKFYCQLPDGRELKIKYGRNNPELGAEVAATRLLEALGFGADRMFIVERVRCAGCPAYPFQALRCYARVGLQAACFPGGIDEGRVIDFDVAVVEQKLEGRVIEAFEDQGWAWYELERIDPGRGGSTRAEVDAFRLMAIFLAHWDNKAPNQRLICPPGFDDPDGTCREPLAIMQDVGATFGPLKIDLHHWRSGRVWRDGATCTVSMEHLPWEGATFPERQISEGGRQLLLGLLEQLRDDQLRALFEGARVPSFDQISGEARRVEAWVDAFNDRVDQIRKGGPCPS
jgi:hypothetical protein